MKWGLSHQRQGKNLHMIFVRLVSVIISKTIICADDTQEHKPNAAPILKYVELSKTDHRKVLYIGDSKYDSKCAENAGIDFALAVWGSHNKHIKADYFLEKPANLLSAITSEKFY